MKCLYTNCRRPGEPLDEGYGFRFCGIHMHIARKVLDRPAPPPGRTRKVYCTRGHLRVPQNLNDGRSCKAYHRAYQAIRRRNLDPSVVQELSDEKFAEIMGGNQ